MLFLLTDSPQKLKLGKIPGILIILFYEILSFPQLQSLFFFLLETQKKTTIQQVNSGKTINVVFKEMLELFLKILKKIDFFFMKIELQYSKEDCKSYTKRKTSNHKLS